MFSFCTQGVGCAGLDSETPGLWWWENPASVLQEEENQPPLEKERHFLPDPGSCWFSPSSCPIYCFLTEERTQFVPWELLVLSIFLPNLLFPHWGKKAICPLTASAKAHEGSEISSCLQASKLAFYHFIGRGRRHKIPESKTKVKVAQLCLTLSGPHGLYSPWNSPGQNTGVGSLSLLQGIFKTQGSNPGLLHCRWILNQLSHQGSPRVKDRRPH